MCEAGDGVDPINHAGTGGLVHSGPTIPTRPFSAAGLPQAARASDGTRFLSSGSMTVSARTVNQHLPPGRRKLATVCSPPKRFRKHPVITRGHSCASETIRSHSKEAGRLAHSAWIVPRRVETVKAYAFDRRRRLHSKTKSCAVTTITNDRMMAEAYLTTPAMLAGSIRACS